jgi:hypothetical protein
MAYYNQSGPRGVDYSVTQLANENTLGGESRKKISDKTLYGTSEEDATATGLASYMKKWEEDGIGKVSPIHGKSSPIAAAKSNDDLGRVLADLRKFKSGDQATADEEGVDKNYFRHHESANKYGTLNMESSMHIEKLGALIWLSLTANRKTAAVKDAKIDVKRLFKLLGLGALGTLGAGTAGMGYAGAQTEEGQEALQDIGQSGADIFSGIGSKAKDTLGAGGDTLASLINRAAGEAKTLGTNMLEGTAEGADSLKNYMDDITKTNGLNLYQDIITGIFGE